jgi:excisionase family DNA binding protein
VTSDIQLTPRELADAIGVSESSLRRWVDAGDIRMTRTVGGHRRIPIAEAIRFVRKIGAKVARPDILGLPDLSKAGPPIETHAGESAFFEFLSTGNRAAARGMILSRYLAGQSLASLFDGPVREVMHRLGELWKHEARGILIEHRATEICLEAVAALRQLLPQPGKTAPLAIGGAPQGDPYLLPTMMAGAVLADAGFQDVNFGANTPVDLLAGEAIERSAKLVWLSISAPLDAKGLRSQIDHLAALALPHGIDVVIGGRHSREFEPLDQSNVHIVDSMSELAAFARGLRSRQKPSAPSRKASPNRKVVAS